MRKFVVVVKSFQGLLFPLLSDVASARMPPMRNSAIFWVYEVA